MSIEMDLLRSTVAHVRDGEWEEARQVMAHEGAKKSLEHGLNLVADTEVGIALLEAYANQDHGLNLSTSIGGIALESPIGLGAGWDKTGKTLRAWQALGAGFAIPGGISYYGQPGNPMPRLFTFNKQFGDGGGRRSLNYHGFPGPRAEVVAEEIGKLRDKGLTMPVIGQITVNKEFIDPQLIGKVPEMLRRTAAILAPVVDGISVGLNSPNIKGMRDQQNRGFTKSALEGVHEGLGDAGFLFLPVEYKGDGDGGEERLDAYAEHVNDGLIDILSLINTTSSLAIKARYGAEDQAGGFAGDDSDFRRMSRDAVKYIYEAVGDKVDIIGMGGVQTGSQAVELMLRGASAVGVVSTVRQRGLRVFRDLNNEVVDVLGGLEKFDGRLDDVIGASTQRGAKSSR